MTLIPQLGTGRRPELSGYEPALGGPPEGSQRGLWAQVEQAAADFQAMAAFLIEGNGVIGSWWFIQAVKEDKDFAEGRLSVGKLIPSRLEGFDNLSIESQNLLKKVELSTPLFADAPYDLQEIFRWTGVELVGKALFGVNRVDPDSGVFYRENSGGQYYDEDELYYTLSQSEGPPVRDRMMARWLTDYREYNEQRRLWGSESVAWHGPSVNDLRNYYRKYPQLLDNDQQLDAVFRVSGQIIIKLKRGITALRVSESEVVLRGLIEATREEFSLLAEIEHNVEIVRFFQSKISQKTLQR